MTSELEGRAAIVTGAASGIGAATARCLAQAGARVGVADVDRAGAEAVAKEIGEAASGEAFALSLDVTDPAENDRAVEAVQDRYGPLRIAHLNAGVASGAGVLDVTLEDWDRLHAVNLRGVFLGLQSAGRAMREHGQGGSIVITSSGAGLKGNAGMANYCSTKHAVLGLMKCAAADLGPLGIRVNAVCPGVIDTPILGGLHGNRELLNSTTGRNHLVGRVGDPEEVGRFVTFLAGDAASFVTGSALPVDGGLHATFGGPALGQG